jgi:hypothetical protein
MSSIFLPLIFLPTRLLIPAVAIKGRKMGGRKMKSKSSHQFFWDATWNNIVTYCTRGITNAVAEGIDSNIMSIQRRTGGYRNGGLDLYPQQCRMDPEKGVLDAADMEFYQGEYERLTKELEHAFEKSKLPEMPTGRDALNDLLVRLRLRDVRLLTIDGLAGQSQWLKLGD